METPTDKVEDSKQSTKSIQSEETQGKQSHQQQRDPKEEQEKKLERNPKGNDHPFDLLTGEKADVKLKDMLTTLDLKAEENTTNQKMNEVSQSSEQHERSVEKSSSKVPISEQLDHQVNAGFQINWRHGPDMPFGMEGPIQSLKINDILYVGGGMTQNITSENVVMAYNTKSCQWHTLPGYRTKGFAMTAMNNKLVLVGGNIIGFSHSNELGEWQPDSNQWTRPFPPMSRKRYDPSATSHKHYIVVAGGYNDFRLMDSVEVLDVTNMQWSAGPPTPTPWRNMVSTTTGDTWYLMGGRHENYGWCPDIYSVSLEEVVTYSDPHNFDIFWKWSKLPSVNCRYSSPLTVGGSLVAVGGVDMVSSEPVSTIRRYNADTDAWIKIGELPHQLWSCTCIQISDEVYIIGGKSGYIVLKEMMITDMSNIY